MPDERPFDHRPVLLDRVVELLSAVPEGLFVDATVGGGGHAEAVLDAHPGSGSWGSTATTGRSGPPAAAWSGSAIGWRSCGARSPHSTSWSVNGPGKEQVQC